MFGQLEEGVERAEALESIIIKLKEAIPPDAKKVNIKVEWQWTDAEATYDTALVPQLDVSWEK